MTMEDFNVQNEHQEKYVEEQLWPLKNTKPALILCHLKKSPFFKGTLELWSFVLLKNFQ